MIYIIYCTLPGHVLNNPYGTILIMREPGTPTPPKAEQSEIDLTTELGREEFVNHLTELEAEAQEVIEALRLRAESENEGDSIFNTFTATSNKIHESLQELAESTDLDDISEINAINNIQTLYNQCIQDVNKLVLIAEKVGAIELHDYEEDGEMEQDYIIPNSSIAETEAALSNSKETDHEPNKALENSSSPTGLPDTAEKWPSEQETSQTSESNEAEKMITEINQVVKDWEDTLSTTILTKFPSYKKFRGFLNLLTEQIETPPSERSSQFEKYHTLTIKELSKTYTALSKEVSDYQQHLEEATDVSSNKETTATPVDKNEGLFTKETSEIVSNFTSKTAEWKRISTESHLESLPEYQLLARTIRKIQFLQSSVPAENQVLHRHLLENAINRSQELFLQIDQHITTRREEFEAWIGPEMAEVADSYQADTTTNRAADKKTGWWDSDFRDKSLSNTDKLTENNERDDASKIDNTPSLEDIEKIETNEAKSDKENPEAPQTDKKKANETVERKEANSNSTILGLQIPKAGPEGALSAMVFAEEIQHNLEMARLPSQERPSDFRSLDLKTRVMLAAARDVFSGTAYKVGRNGLTEQQVETLHIIAETGTLSSPIFETGVQVDTSHLKQTIEKIKTERGKSLQTKLPNWGKKVSQWSSSAISQLKEKLRLDKVSSDSNKQYIGASLITTGIAAGLLVLHLGSKSPEEASSQPNETPGMVFESKPIPEDAYTDPVPEDASKSAAEEIGSFTAPKNTELWDIAFGNISQTDTMPTLSDVTSPIERMEIWTTFVESLIGGGDAETRRIELFPERFSNAPNLQIPSDRSSITLLTETKVSLDALNEQLETIKNQVRNKSNN